jgi:YVTN family beta-propeller protein
LAVLVSTIFGLALFTPPEIANAAPTSSLVPLASIPVEVVDAGSKAYVLNADNISVINTTTNQVIGTITPPTPIAGSYFAFGVYVPSDGSLWVSRYTETSGQVLRINTADDSITNTYNATGPSGIAATATKIYVAMRYYPATIAVFDIASKARETNLNYTGSTVGHPNYSTNFSPYILSIVGDILYIFQGNTGNVIPWTISTGTQGAAYSTGVGAGASYAAVNPAGTHVYVGSGTNVRKIPVGATSNSLVIGSLTNAGGIAFSSDGSKIFVTANPNLLVLDASTQALIGQATTTGLTNGIAVVNSGRYLYVGLVRTSETSQLFQIDIDPTVSSVAATLTVNTVSSIAPPVVSDFWTDPTFTSTNLPAGLSLDPVTGEITGTPTVPQAATNVTITATTPMFVRTTIFTITVIDPNAPAPAPAPSPTPDVLPATGAIITPAVILGTMTLLLGVAMIFTRRRLRK